MALTLLVTGSRYAGRDHAPFITTKIREAAMPWHPTVTLWHGAARGADTIAGHVADMMGWDVREFPANWEVYKASAGPIRNLEMITALLEQPGPIMCIAFPAPGSRGTGDCITKAWKAGIPTRIWPLSADSRIPPEDDSPWKNVINLKGL